MILAAGTDYLTRCVQTACPSSLQMALGIPSAPSCREESVPLGHCGEEEEEEEKCMRVHCGVSPPTLKSFQMSVLLLREGVLRSLAISLDLSPQVHFSLNKQKLSCVRGQRTL